MLQAADTPSESFSVQACNGILYQGELAAGDTLGLKLGVTELQGCQMLQFKQVKSTEYFSIQTAPRICNIQICCPTFIDQCWQFWRDSLAPKAFRHLKPSERAGAFSGVVMALCCQQEPTAAFKAALNMNSPKKHFLLFVSGAQMIRNPAGWEK